MTSVTQEGAPLERYVQRALGDIGVKIFEPSPDVTPPTLRRGRINRVIVYRGSFNPPHHGHKETLCHAFFRAGSDLNIVAAFIRVLDDDAVQAKLNRRRSDRPPIVFTKAQRIAMWNSGQLSGGWHWCVPSLRHTKYSRTSSLYRQITNEAARDGYDVRFIHLIGEDINPCMDDEESLICGGGVEGRKELVGETPGGLRSLSGFTDWKEVEVKDNDLELLETGVEASWLEAKLDMLYMDKASNLPSNAQDRLRAIKDRLRTATNRAGQIRECRHQLWHNKWIRFIPKRFIGMTGGAGFLGTNETPTSSSRILEIIWSATSAKKAMEQLEGVALAPDLVLQLPVPCGTLTARLGWKNVLCLVLESKEGEEVAMGSLVSNLSGSRH
ncbi:hypothetical protein K491DRAFT_678673 [Lophiostoma macrostomum CBS 122681]|uniref:Cytidyltransferase-like domain-containing protein n=1 Tax=Lophiostoma macrostomum CBS 122681 TaxID=1314788 RepID=A0A6A6TA01_9PLEO|nr:hypothetical protein K491DRAFT_678673 [Lophiostoma macrostomum CBS 122681]